MTPESEFTTLNVRVSKDTYLQLLEAANFMDVSLDRAVASLLYHGLNAIFPEGRADVVNAMRRPMPLGTERLT